MRKYIGILIMAVTGYGCGVNSSAESAVRETSFGELLISTQISKNADGDEISRKLNQLRAVVNFDVDKTIGHGVDNCQGISNFKSTVQKVAEDASLIKSTFSVDRKYDVELTFIGRTSGYVGTTLISRPIYLMSLSVIADGQVIYEEPLDNHETMDMLLGITAKCNINQIIDNKYKQYTAARAQE